MPKTASCGCHTDIDEAIRAHMGIVQQVLSSPSLHIPKKDYEEARSDALEALWKALTTVDTSVMRLGPYLRVKVTQKVIDGLRKRGIDTRHGAQTNKAKQALIYAAPIDATIEETWATGSEWDDFLFSSLDDTASKLMRLAWYIDADLPTILRYTSLGFSCPEIQAECGLKSVVKKLLSFKRYVEKFPDLEYRPDYKWSNREWQHVPTDHIVAAFSKEN